MKKIKFSLGNKNDFSRIKRVLEENGFEASITECEKLWEKYSDSRCAQYMILPDDDKELFECVEYFIEDLLE